MLIYRNINLELATKGRACKVASQEGSLIITFHILGSAKERAGMNPHTPKWTPILGVGIPMDSWILKGKFQGSKLIGLKISLYHWKATETYMYQMGLHDPFGYLKHKLWYKKRPGVKSPIWLPIIKSQEYPRFPCMKVACDIPLKSSWQGL
jgi:hypothetical protein